jgi:DNA-binding MarR family transcriptional regulator
LRYAGSVTPPLPETPRRRATEAEARALASALRLRILRLCLDDELTNKEIAERLDRDPASVLHHVRKLVDTGFLQPLEPRRGARNAREVPYRATGKSWRLEVGERQGHRSQSAVMLEAFLDELGEAGGELVDASRLGLRLNEAHREEFSDRLSALLNEFAARPPDPDGERWSIFYGMHADRRGRRSGN